MVWPQHEPDSGEGFGQIWGWGDAQEEEIIFHKRKPERLCGARLKKTNQGPLRKTLMLSRSTFSWYNNLLLSPTFFFFFFGTGAWTQSLAQVMSQGLFAFVIFVIGSSVSAWAIMDHQLPIYASCIAGMTGMRHHTQLLVELRSC
jgi:hypothetical protein